jgi:retinol dehydrogenase 12
VIVTAVNPDFCRSQLARHRSFIHSAFAAIKTAILAHTTEEGSRQLVWAAVGGIGREFEPRGAYMSNANANLQQQKCDL